LFPHYIIPSSQLIENSFQKLKLNRQILLRKITHSKKKQNYFKTLQLRKKSSR